MKSFQLKRDLMTELVCPRCHQKRAVKWSSYWTMKLKNHIKICVRCANQKITSTSFKKGMVPWNKGLGKASFWERIKASNQWKEIRRTVFERDDYTCQICNVRGGILHPDHIKPKVAFPELVFTPSNIRTLCRDCHKKTDTYGRHGRALVRQLKAIK